MDKTTNILLQKVRPLRDTTTLWLGPAYEWVKRDLHSVKRRVRILDRSVRRNSEIPLISEVGTARIPQIQIPYKFPMKTAPKAVVLYQHLQQL